MTHAGAVRAGLERWGRPLLRVHGEETSAGRGLLQPLRYKNKMYLEGVPTDIGLSTGEYDLLLAPPGFLTGDTDRDRIFCGGVSYSVIRKEDICLAETPVYTWAVLRKTTEQPAAP